MSKNVRTKPAIDTVSADTVEASIKAKDIGQKIRCLRLKRSMGLVELGQQVGLSASYLSQLETGRVIPTLRNLARIALAFQKDFSDFLGEQEAETLFRISRSKERIRLVIGEKDAPFLLADSMSILLRDPKTAPCVAEFLPGVEGVFRPHIFPGHELVYVIDGPLVLSTEHKTELLHSEDCAWIDGNTRRQYKCHDYKAARALIMTFALQS